jgi:hypothetical protein
MRARLRLIDWTRSSFGDGRYGRTVHPKTVEFDDELHTATI